MMYTVSRLVAFGSLVHALVFALALQVALRGAGGERKRNQSGGGGEAAGGLMKRMIQDESFGGQGNSGESVRGGLAGVLHVYANMRRSILSIAGGEHETALTAAPLVHHDDDVARRGNEHPHPRPQRGARGVRVAVSHHMEETERGLLHKILSSAHPTNRRPKTGDGHGREKNEGTSDTTRLLPHSRRSTSPPTSSGSAPIVTGASLLASTMGSNWQATAWIMSSVLSSNVKAALALNVLFPLLLLFLVAVKETFFGNITATETTHAVECAARHHVMAFLIIACLYSESVSTELTEVFLWISFFGVLAVAKIIACMAKDRFDTLSNYSDDKISERVLIVALLSGVIVCCWYIVLSVVVTVLAFGGNPHYALVMLIQPLIVILECSHSLFKYVLHLHETGTRQRQHREEEEQHTYCSPASFGANGSREHIVGDDIDGQRRRTTTAAAAAFAAQKSVALLDREWYSYLSSTAELMADTLILPLSLLNILVVWYIHGLNLQILDGLLVWKVKRLAHTILVKLLSWHASRRTLVHLQSQFPAATASELEDYADECAICKDHMCSGRVLHCGHIFHLTCLQRWAGMGHANNMSCPICRATFQVHGKKRPQAHMHFAPAATTAAFHAARGGGHGGGMYEQRRRQRGRQHEQHQQQQQLERSSRGRGRGSSSGESSNSSTSVDSVDVDEVTTNAAPNAHTVPRRWYNAMPHSLRRRVPSSGVGESGSSDAALHHDNHDDGTGAESIEPVMHRHHTRQNMGRDHARGPIAVPPHNSSLWEWGWTRSAEMWYGSRIAMNFVVSRDVS